MFLMRITNIYKGLHLKQMTIMQRHLTLPSVGLVFAPSVASADASWYGSLRARLHSQDGHTVLKDGSSRWGVKGSSEVSEGLTAVYQYETAVDLGDASMGDGRISFVGLSGGFGSISAGHLWSAFYNHIGAVTDTGVGSTNEAGVSYRSSNTVSYAASTGPVSFQLDLTMAPDADVTAVDTNLSGDALAADQKRFAKESMAAGAVKGKSLDMAQFGMTLDTGFATVGLGAKSKDKGDATEKKIGSVKANGFAVSFPLAGFNIYASHTTIKDKTDASNMTVKKKHVHSGITGGLGDTGMTFGVNFADIDDGDDTTMDGENPWNAHIAKSLGGGASLALEYIDNDSKTTKDEALVQLTVSF